MTGIWAIPIRLTMRLAPPGGGLTCKIHLGADGRGRPLGIVLTEAYKGRNVVERRFNRLKQWRGIAMRSDKTARSYLAGITLAVALIWASSQVYDTP